MTKIGSDTEGVRSPIGATPCWLHRAWSVLFVCIVAACRPGTVLRVSDGHAFEERTIAPEAYAAYLRGKLFEQKGDKARAADQYRLVLSKDPEALEAMVRLGVIGCTRSAAEGLAWFARAEQLDTESPRLWLERARCELMSGHFEVALSHAQRSLRYRPTSDEALSIVVSATAALNRPDSGLIWLRAALAAEPNDARLWKLLFEYPRASKAERLYSASQLIRLRPQISSDIPDRFHPESVRRGTVENAAATMLEWQLEQALTQDNVDSARSLATRLGVNPEQLAVLAFKAGSYALASAQAELLLAIDPDNSTVWAVRVLAADAQCESARITTLLAHPPKRPLPVESPLTKSILALVSRRAAFELLESTQAGAEVANPGSE